MVCCQLVCPHAWCSCAAEGHAPARQKMRHNKPSDSSHRRNRDNIPSLSLHLPCCTARCGPRSTSLSLFSPSIHLSLHVRTTLRPSPTAGRHSFTSDGLIMAPLSLRSLDRTWSAHSVALSPSFCRLHAHTHTPTCTEMLPFIQVDAVRGGSQGKLIKLKAGPAVC